jgi:RNA polymerase sigma-70 factor (ECF subfamily)
MREGSRVGEETDHRQFLDATLAHLPAVYNLARRMARDEGRADDLVQETYLRAFRAFDSYRGGSMRAWLVAICLNAARSEARRLRRRPEEVLDADPQVSAGTQDVCEAAVASCERDGIVRALRRLPEPQRTALVLMDVAGLTATEAAEVMACPRGTVLARVHRGRRRLAALLEREGIRGL